jgi:hypothetical protein
MLGNEPVQFGKGVTEKAREGPRRYSTSFGEGRRLNVPQGNALAAYSTQEDEGAIPDTISPPNIEQ